MYRRIVASAWIALAAVPTQAEVLDNRTIIAEVRRILTTDYVVPDMRAPLDATLRQGLDAGRYDGLDPTTLAERINADLAAVAHDAHLAIRYAPSEAAAMPVPRADDDDAPDPFLDEQARRWNQGVVEQRVLDGNIRYLDYRGFMWSGVNGQASAAAQDRAIDFLRGGDAIIIDLRANGGGDPRAVHHLVNYFVPARTKLVTFHLRSRPPETIYSAANVPGGRIVGKPIYVLTSPQTVSAAEEFASHVTHFGFGTLVGSTTRGGAYRNTLYPVGGRYVLSVSIGRPELSDGTNWEGRGIAPGIAVSPDAALDAAQAAALRQLAARSPADQAVFARLADFHQAQVTRIAPTRDLAAYAGRYGPRTVRVDGANLTIQRGQGGISTLIPIGRDRFALSLDPATQAQFTGDARITGMSIERADGRSEPAERVMP